jgi:hypothetical protein
MNIRLFLNQIVVTFRPCIVDYFIENFRRMVKQKNFNIGGVIFAGNLLTFLCSVKCIYLKNVSLKSVSNCHIYPIKPWNYCVTVLIEQ